MSRSQSQVADGSPSSGVLTLATTVITLVTLAVGMALIQPRLAGRRAAIGQKHILTTADVKALPQGTLAVVLDRSPGQDQHDFHYQLLQLVMQRSGRPYALGFSEQAVSQDEAVAVLDSIGLPHGRRPIAITVGVYGAGMELNRRLLPVPIPVMGGMLGLRAGWSHVDEQRHLASVRTHQDLREIVLLQGLGWSDLEIFEAAGLRTFTERSEELLRLVDNRRVQLFPRGIAELEREVEMVRTTTVATQLDPHLLIAYPFAGFFYVSRSNPALAAAIRQGFERAIADGSYQALLERLVLTPWLREHLQLKRRLLLTLPNPVAASVLADVQPRHWIVPWGTLVSGTVTTGDALCSAPALRTLCPD